jgi:hypothetical protein
MDHLSPLCSVPWIDDKGNVQINRGFRVQFNSAIGPFKVRLIKLLPGLHFKHGPLIRRMLLAAVATGCA